MFSNRRVPFGIGWITRRVAPFLHALLSQSLLALLVKLYQLTVLVDEISGQARDFIKVSPILWRDGALKLEQGRLDLFLVNLKIRS
ncbi:hypothetical protein N184_34350 [Sinorhizobium sp. GL28]|nr:hypothetical protein N184_34350 [Sinorhizobium sp. GL28]